MADAAVCALTANALSAACTLSSRTSVHPSSKCLYCNSRLFAHTFFQAVCASILPKLCTFSGASLSKIAAALGDLNAHPPDQAPPFLFDQHFNPHPFDQSNSPLFEQHSQHTSQQSLSTSQPQSASVTEEGRELMEAFWQVSKKEIRSQDRECRSIHMPE